MTQRHSARYVLLAVAIAAAVCRGPVVHAQTAAAAEVKAAWLINFAKFTEWPALSSGSAARVLCVVGDDRVSAALTEAVRGQSAEGRPLTSVRVTPDADARTCHVLFVSDVALRTSRAVLDSVRTLPILTVSDASRFAESSGMIELFLQNERMRFSVNLEAVERSKLRISSRLLSFANIVRGTDAR
jgi:hypothetical protein